MPPGGHISSRQNLLRSGSHSVDHHSVDHRALISRGRVSEIDPVPEPEGAPMSSSQSSVRTTQNPLGSSRSWAQRLPVVLRPGRALGYELMRAYLGIGLFVRGVLFVSEPELLLGYMQD